MDKKYLFIFQSGQNDILVTRYITDDAGYLKEEAKSETIPDIGKDNRIGDLETAIFQKIYIHHRLGKEQVSLVESIEETLKKLLVGDRVTIFFDALGRPREHVFFEKEDNEVNFSWNRVTANSYKSIVSKIEKAVDTPLSIFNEIYANENLFKANNLFSGMRSEKWSDKIVTSHYSIIRRKNEFQELTVLTPEQRQNDIEVKTGIIEQEDKDKREKANYASLLKNWERHDLNLNEKITACQTFLKDYPNSLNLTVVKAKLTGLLDESAWEKADYTKTINAYSDYLVQFEKGSYKEAAQKGILNLEIKYKNAIVPLEQKIQADALEIAEFEEMTQRFKRKSKLLMWGILLALVAGCGISFFFLPKSVNQAVASEKNPLYKRVDDLIENRIYIKQQQLKKDSEGAIVGSDEIYTLLKNQDNIHKALFDIHKVKFESLPLLDSNRISANEVEKEIIRIENQIK